MLEELRRIGNALRSGVTRAKVTQATVGPRTILQVTGLDNESFDGVELLLPPGYVALPTAQSDVLLLQCNASRDHKVALGGDLVGQTVADLAPGEGGLRFGTHQVILRQDGVELLGDGEPLRHLVTDIFMQLFNAHTHQANGAGPPLQPMTAAHLTATTRAGGGS